jgi:hypothetical protein
VTVIAHVGGVPVEELIPMAASAGSVLLLARASLSLLRRDRGAGHQDRRPTHADHEPQHPREWEQWIAVTRKR